MSVVLNHLGGQELLHLPPTYFDILDIREAMPGGFSTMTSIRNNVKVRVRGREKVEERKMVEKGFNSLIPSNQLALHVP